MTSKKKNRDKAFIILIILGLRLFLSAIPYMVFTVESGWLAEKLEKGKVKAVEIAGILAVAEGTVTHSDSNMTKISYYYVWDGTNYNVVIPYGNPHYPENTKVIAVYALGFAPGTCFISGFYMTRYLLRAALGMVMVILGMLGKRMEDKNGKKKDCSRKLEDEHDAKRGC